MTARDRSAKEGSCNPVQENTSPSSGAQTIGLFPARSRERETCLNENPSAEESCFASRIARVIEPRAMDVATVTRDFGPKTEASNANPTAAEFGKLTVKARTELSEVPSFSCERAHRKVSA